MMGECKGVVNNYLTRALIALYKVGMNYKRQLQIYSERRARIQKAFKDGMAAERIAKLWKISRQRVYQILMQK